MSKRQSTDDLQVRDWFDRYKGTSSTNIRYVPIILLKLVVLASPPILQNTFKHEPCLRKPDEHTHYLVDLTGTSEKVRLSGLPDT
jgi:hypothetical protein